MRRFGQVIELQPGCVDLYKQAHANVWRPVLEKISQCHIQNYSIYLYNNTLFAYFEYVGKDFERDMASMAADPETQKWWDFIKPMQKPVNETDNDEWWKTIEEVFHHD